jgi:hypothetical protein
LAAWTGERNLLSATAHRCAIKSCASCSQVHHREFTTFTFFVVRANDKHLARLNIIKDMLTRLYYEGKGERLILPDPQIVFAYDASNLENGQRAK